MHIGFWRSQGKQTRGMEMAQFAGNFSLGQMSCNICWIHNCWDRLQALQQDVPRHLTCLSQWVFQEVEFLEQAKGLQPLSLEDLSAVSAYDQNGSDWRMTRLACLPLYSVGLLKIWKSLILTDQRLALHSHRPGNCYREKLGFVNCRYNEHYEHVKN